VSAHPAPAGRGAERGEYRFWRSGGREVYRSAKTALCCRPPTRPATRRSPGDSRGSGTPRHTPACLHHRHLIWAYPRRPHHQRSGLGSGIRAGHAAGVSGGAIAPGATETRQRRHCIRMRSSDGGARGYVGVRECDGRELAPVSSRRLCARFYQCGTARVARSERPGPSVPSAFAVSLAASDVAQNARASSLRPIASAPAFSWQAVVRSRPPLGIRPRCTTTVLRSPKSAPARRRPTRPSAVEAPRVRRARKLPAAAPSVSLLRVDC